MINRTKPETHPIPEKTKKQRGDIKKTKLMAEIDHLCKRVDSLPELHPLYEEIIISIEKLNVEFQAKP